MDLYICRNLGFDWLLVPGIPVSTCKYQLLLTFNCMWISLSLFPLLFRQVLHLFVTTQGQCNSLYSSPAFCSFDLNKHTQTDFHKHIWSAFYFQKWKKGAAHYHCMYDQAIIGINLDSITEQPEWKYQGLLCIVSGIITVDLNSHSFYHVITVSGLHI